MTARQRRRIRNGCCKRAFASGWKPAARRAGQRQQSWLCAKHDSRQDARRKNRNGQKTGNGRIRRCYRVFNRRLTIIRRDASREHQERKCFSFLYCTMLYQAEARKAKTVISTLNSSPGSFPFSINVMMMPATIIHATPLQRRNLSATTLIRIKATARIPPQSRYRLKRNKQQVNTG